LAAQQVIGPNFRSVSEWVPIGRPVPGVEIVLCSADGATIAGEGTGEIVLRSDRVALGYWPPRDRATAPFGRDPASGTPTYATGDLAARRRDGTLVHLGRLDDQIKIKGCRVEPVEVEAHLTAIAGVRQGVVAVRRNVAGNRLAAWFVPDPARNPGPQEVRRALQARLPAVMIPSTIVSLPTLPLLPTGKIDRQALLGRNGPAPAVRNGASLRDVIADIWSRTLDVTGLTPADNFFALGGDSLQALTVQLEAEASTGRAMPSLFSHPTITAITRYLQDAIPDKAPAARDASPVTPLSPPQQRYWARIEDGQDDAAFHIALVLEVKGRVDAAALAAALATIASQNDALRTGFAVGDPVPVQNVTAETTPLTLRRLSRRLPAADWQRSLDRLAKRHASRPFELQRPGLMRACLVSRSTTSHALVLSFHHLVIDGWARLLFETRLFREYGRQLAKLPPSPDRTPGYLAASADMTSRSLREASSRARPHPLLQRVTGLGDPAIRLPFDGAGGISTTTSSLSWKLDGTDARAIHDCARAFRSTPFAVIATMFSIALSSWTGQRTIVVTTDRSNRYGRDWEVIGLFSDVAPIVVEVGPSSPFSATLQATHRALTEAQAPDMPFFSDLVEHRWPGGLHRYDEIFPVAIAMEQQEGWRERPGDVSVRTREVSCAPISRDLVLVATESIDDTLTLRLLYRSRKFRRATVARLMRALKAAYPQTAQRPTADRIVSRSAVSHDAGCGIPRR
jgi:hypothetical protein